jgi:hypothetical protein
VTALRGALWWLAGLGAIVLGLAAAAGLLRLVPDMSLFGSAVLHGFAVLLCYASVRYDGRLPIAEQDIVLLTALFLPGFGPALAWTFPRRAGAARNAHAAFEADSADASGYARSTLSGDIDRDIARELNTMSVAQVMGGDSIEHKRSLLRALARVGEVRHLAILRRCLHDGEPEIRLCAYGELAKLSREREERIAELREQAQAASEGDLEPLAELAAEYRRYAASGILDPKTSEYWLRQAVKASGQVLEHDPEHERAAITNALGLADLDQYGEALQVLKPLADTPEVLLAHAEVAVRMRDFDTARDCAAELGAQDEVVPSWLAAVASGVPEGAR